MAVTTRDPRADIKQLMAILEYDREERLLGIDAYIYGNQADPYVPAEATEEYKLLVRRAVTNQMPLVISVATQSLAVDSVRPGRDLGEDTDETKLPEWQHWQYSRLDARQHGVHFDALGYGHAFTVTELDKKGKVFTRAYSPLASAALFEDPANNPLTVSFELISFLILVGVIAALNFSRRKGA